MAKLEPEVLKINDWAKPYGSAEVRIYVNNSLSIKLRFEKQEEDTPRLTNLDISAIGNSKINTTVMQKLNLGKLIDISLEKLNEVGLNSEYLDYAIEFISDGKNWVNTGNKPLPDLNYACTAFVYHYLKTSGTKKIIQKLAELSNVESIDTIKKRVQETKNRDFISIKKTKSTNRTYLSQESFKIMTKSMRMPKEKK
jgi:hypothetical protein